MVPKEKKMVEEVGEVVTILEQEVRQPTIEAMTSSVEVAIPLVSVSLASFFLYLDLYILICLLTCNLFSRSNRAQGSWKH